MVRKLLPFVLALLFLGVRPAPAAPVVRATLSHMCCDHCVNALRNGVAGVGWVADVQINRSSKTFLMTAKPAQTIDIVTLTAAFEKVGFPPQDLVLEGVGTVEIRVGHICCAGCVNPLKEALAKVAWIGSADVKPNAPIRISAVDGALFKLTELVSVIRRAGFAPQEVLLLGP